MALLEVTEEVNPVTVPQVGAVPAVVNCAVVYVLDALAQFVLTLQSYTDEAAKPLIATEVAVVAVAAFVHTASELSL